MVFARRSSRGLMSLGLMPLDSTSLESLTLGDSFNQSIEGLRLPELQSLTFGNDFNRPMLDIHVPKLQKLTFGDSFLAFFSVQKMRGRLQREPGERSLPEAHRVDLGQRLQAETGAHVPRELGVSRHLRELEIVEKSSLRAASVAGFGAAKVLSGKFTNLYKLSSEPLRLKIALRYLYTMCFSRL